MPQEIVDIFERHGFIWGGKWYHYDKEASVNLRFSSKKLGL
jgi:D-alanyl-D-alanine carboxypeptidase